MTTPTISIRLPQDLRQRLRQYAAADNKTRTEVVTQALRDFFERESTSSRQYRIQQELARLAEIDKTDPELNDSYNEPEADPFAKEP